ncbi:AbrB/MazE/SpoVT family DNA-binding domain-containing protein [Rhodospira trueperi]|uniref:Antitoxin ChpS n=1 Tax=Rhodospira trueperi TaxID=69960 RepID=A0A1G7BXU6_9PROT|nr:AbrB/MazE/SpoVT family DNA-binding domain-containing protein [Rhodospira trueperi]SDE31226.1 antitoxin ChpS [Rhodospira trueperi]
MHTVRLRQVGGSVMLTIPPAFLDALRLSAGAEVGLAVDAGRLVIELHARPRYLLDELLAQCDPAAEVSDEDRAWQDAEPTGTEIL